MFKPYPITVEPILKEQIWGGYSLARFVRVPHGRKIGEAWFFAEQQGNCSMVSNGEYSGMTMDELMKRYSDRILGPELSKKYNGKFPLLFKFIDSRDRLSVQVHPDDEMAAKYENATGKTEAWYVINSNIGAYVLVGFRAAMPRERVAKLVRDGRLTGELHKFHTRKGDGYYIPSGTVHSIGPGNLIYEIQQNSAVTYRLYDWGRQNLGVQRDLQLGPGSEAVRFDSAAGKSSGRAVNRNGLKIKPIVSCGYFSVSEARMSKGGSYFFDNRPPLVIALMYGEIEIQREDERYRFKRGSVILVPEIFTGFSLKANKKSKFVVTEVK